MILPYLLFVIVLIQESFEESINDDEISSNLNRILTTRVFKPLNVIIFLANPDEYNKKFIDGHYNDSGFKFLNFPLYTTVKCCSQIVSNDQSDISLSPGCNCEPKLNRNLRSLIDWVQKKQEMITAFISARDSSNEIINQYNINKPDKKINHYHREKMIHKKIPIRDPLEIVRDKDIFEQLPLPNEPSYERTYLNDEYMPVVKKLEVIDTDNIPIYNIFNPGYKSEDKPKSKLKEVQSIIRFINPRFAGSTEKWNYINHGLRPSIRVKRSLLSTEEESDTNDNVDYEIYQDDNTWNGFGILEMLRNTFLESFFNPSNIFYSQVINMVLPFVKRQMENVEDNSINFDMLGKIEDLSYSELVRSTLQRLQKESKRNADLHQNRNRGYMLVVRAGNLSDLVDAQSELVQTMKIIMENTGEETLIVLSGSCPSKNSHIAKVPLYATGSCYKKLNGSSSTTNMLQKIRTCLQETPIPFNDLIKTDTDTNYKKSYAEYLQELMNGNVLVTKDRYSRFLTAQANRTNLICYLLAIFTAFLFYPN